MFWFAVEYIRFVVKVFRFAFGYVWFVVCEFLFVVKRVLVSVEIMLVLLLVIYLLHFCFDYIVVDVVVDDGCGNHDITTCISVDVVVLDDGCGDHDITTCIDVAVVNCGCNLLISMVCN